LAQAARSAAEADGVAPPADADRHDNKSNGEDLLSRLSANGNMTQDSALAAMERARAAVNAASAGTAAHLLAANPARKNPVPGPPPGSSGGGKKKGPPLRRGKWTPEEEAYANRLIQEFKAGLLPLTDGTTLRTFLSKLLNCDPMRISKKFVGSNCIGKQVFRRRTADINRLTAEQIQQSRAELSDLERRFLERVAQTNRVKSSGVGGGAGTTTGTNPNEKAKDEMDNNPQSPPWLNPPVGYKHGLGASMASANLSGGGTNRSAAAAGRALLHGLGSSDFNDAFGQHAFGQKQSNPSLSSRGSAGLMALAGLGGDSTSRQNLLNALSSRGSASSLFAAAAASNSGSGLSGSAMAQIARNASAARLAGLTAAGSSMNNLLLKSGLSRDQLSQLARDGGVSSASLSNMIDRQSSFDALMSLDLQSLQSIDNLANLIQSGGSLPGQNPQNGLKNWSAGDSISNLAHAAAANGSGGNLSDLASARRLASVGRMQSLLRSLSSQNMQKNSSGGGSNANFSNLLQSMQNNMNNAGNSANSLFGNNNQTNNFNNVSALSLANLLRDNSSTGLSALRQQDGINQRNTSVDDFLSLVAAGDIPHQDPSLLNMSLMHQQQQQGNNQSGAQAAATMLAHQQLLAQVSGSNSALASALAQSGSFGHLQNNSSAASLYGGAGGSAASLFNSASARAALSNLNSSSALKRKLMDLDNHFDQQGNQKR
jgi:lambda repressor-like predicted transcriptional regulator